ncbi:MAG: thioredoxin family protein [Neptuniibacter sp.]
MSASGLPIASDLQAQYKQSGMNETGQKKVVLMLVSQPNCSYCVQITEEILRPMIISGHYESTTLFTELEINTGKKIKDFAGNTASANEFAKRYGAWATPTLLFLDWHGNQIAKKMIGINTPELYGYYVDQALKTAQSKLSP